MAIATDAVMQAWIELRTDDPAAVSALAVARAGFVASSAPEELRRARLVEICGSAKSRAEVEALLHASTQVYNPHKERCTVRAGAAAPLPGPAGAEYVVVWDRDGERRPAVERWWRHETAEEIEVREAVVWMVRFAPGVEAAPAARELAQLRDARHGLLCNPWSQSMRVGAARAAGAWIAPDAATSSGGDA
jgi:hypothetical protein